MGYRPGVVEALQDWGLTVRLVPGWETRGDPYFEPHGHVIHHDVIGDQVGTHDVCPDLIIRGRSDLAGPLANFWLERDGDVHVVAAGEANHAGSGGWNGLSGNASVWGTEMNNLGTPADPWPDVQLEAMQRLAAATAEYSGFPIANVCGHKEWTSRKVDPHSIDMQSFRQEILAQAKGEIVTEEQMRRLERVAKNQGKLTRSMIRKLYLAESRQNRRLSDNEVDAILAAIEAEDPAG